MDEVQGWQMNDAWTMRGSTVTVLMADLPTVTDLSGLTDPLVSTVAWLLRMRCG